MSNMWGFSSLEGYFKLRFKGAAVQMFKPQIFAHLSEPFPKIRRFPGFLVRKG